jgi:hypothetical protein
MSTRPGASPLPSSRLDEHGSVEVADVALGLPRESKRGAGAAAIAATAVLSPPAAVHERRDIKSWWWWRMRATSCAVPSVTDLELGCAGWGASASTT